MKEPRKVHETSGARQARRGVTALDRLGRNTIVAPEFVSPIGACQILSISTSTLWRLRRADPAFPRGVTISGMERISVAALRAWAMSQPSYLVGE
jgi:predicted DNA-binding transcriptional regulator AlpA